MSAKSFESNSKAPLAVSRREAACLLGVSLDFFVEHILPDMRTVICGRRRLVPVAEIHDWLDGNASVGGWSHV